MRHFAGRGMHACGAAQFSSTFASSTDRQARQHAFLLGSWGASAPGSPPRACAWGRTPPSTRRRLRGPRPAGPPARPAPCRSGPGTHPRCTPAPQRTPGTQRRMSDMGKHGTAHEPGGSGTDKTSTQAFPRYHHSMTCLHMCPSSRYTRACVPRCAQIPQVLLQCRPVLLKILGQAEWLSTRDSVHTLPFICIFEGQGRSGMRGGAAGAYSRSPSRTTGQGSRPAGPRSPAPCRMSSAPARTRGSHVMVSVAGACNCLTLVEMLATTKHNPPTGYIFRCIATKTQSWS